MVDANTLYTKHELVGKGSYGSVYKGIHNISQQVVAIKELNLEKEDDVVDIQREIALLSQLRHSDSQNITRYHGSFLNGTKLWIVMDYAAGGSIRTLMKASRIEEKYIAIIAREVLVALTYLHRNNIIHRDIKAANILLTEEGKVQLCDFGVAGQTTVNSDKRHSFVGTLYWMAPEVIKGMPYDFKADIWSFGITMYEIATGYPPFANYEAKRAVIQIPRNPPAQLKGDFTQTLKDFVGACLCQDSEERLTAEELLKHPFIKNSSKLVTSMLRELIARYEQWKRSPDFRRSIGGPSEYGSDTEGLDVADFEDGNDGWNFDFDTLRSDHKRDSRKSGADGSSLLKLPSKNEVPIYSGYDDSFTDNTTVRPSPAAPSSQLVTNDLQDSTSVTSARIYQRSFSDAHPLMRLFDMQPNQSPQPQGYLSNQPSPASSVTTPAELDFTAHEKFGGTSARFLPLEPVDQMQPTFTSGSPTSIANRVNDTVSSEVDESILHRTHLIGNREAVQPLPTTPPNKMDIENPYRPKSPFQSTQPLQPKLRHQQSASTLSAPPTPGSPLPSINRKPPLMHMSNHQIKSVTLDSSLPVRRPPSPDRILKQTHERQASADGHEGSAFGSSIANHGVDDTGLFYEESGQREEVQESVQRMLDGPLVTQQSSHDDMVPLTELIGNANSRFGRQKNIGPPAKGVKANLKLNLKSTPYEETTHPTLLPPSPSGAPFLSPTQPNYTSYPSTRTGSPSLSMFNSYPEPRPLRLESLYSADKVHEELMATTDDLCRWLDRLKDGLSSIQI